MALVGAVAKLCMTRTGSELCKTFVFGLFGPSRQYFDELLFTILNHIPGNFEFYMFFKIKIKNSVFLISQLVQVIDNLFIMLKSLRLVRSYFK